MMNLDKIVQRAFDQTLGDDDHFLWELVNNLDQGVTIVDEDRCLVYANPAFAAMVGRSLPDMIGLDTQIFIHPDDLPILNEQRRRRFAGEQTTYEARFIRPDGSSVFVRITGFPHWNNGVIKGTYALVTDITEQIEAQERLRAGQNIIEQVFATNPNILVVFDLLERRIVFQNRQVLSTVGYTAAEIDAIGSNLLPGILHPDDVGKTLQMFTEIQSIGDSAAYPLEIRVKHKDGSWRWLDSQHAVFKRTPDGQVAQIITAATDITDKKRAEMQLRESEEKLRLLIENAPVALAMFDTEMRYLAYSQRWAIEYQQEGKDLIGHNHYAIFPDLPEYLRLAHAQGLAGEIVREAEDYVVLPNGSSGWSSWEVRPWYKADDTVGGIVIFVQDISERKNAVEALTRSEQQYRTIVEDLTELVVRAGADGTIHFANEAYQRAFAAPDGNIVGTKFYDLLDEAAATLVREKVASLTPAKPVAVDEHQEQLVDGTFAWFYWVDRGIFSEDGELVEIQSVGHDITERYVSEGKLRQSERRLQSILESVPEGVLLLKSDGTILLANPVATRYFDVLAPAWVGGEPLRQLGDRPVADLLQAPLEEWQEITFAGRIFEVSAQPVVDHGDQSDYVMVLWDVTRQRDIQRQVQTQERLAAVGQLAAGIAHDFNNIMAVITLYAQLMLRSNELSDRFQERMRTVVQQSQRATDLIQQILDFGRQSVLEARSLDLGALMGTLVKILKRTLPENIQISLTADEDLHHIKADATRIQQLMMNLAVNARDAMPDGGKLAINLARLPADQGPFMPQPSEDGADWICLSVTDSGSGIAPDILPHIFEPFFTTKGAGKGTGLGLAQIYGIMQQHGGQVNVTSTVGEGTTFLMYFPAIASTEISTIEPGTGTLVMGQGQHVLLVEDDPATREALFRSLAFLNYKVREASNGQEALALLAENIHSFDLVISDVVMPEMGGPEMLRLMHEQQLKIPVVFLTGHPMGTEMDSLRALGMAGWLPKPPNLEMLGHLLAQTLA